MIKITTSNFITKDGKVIESCNEVHEILGLQGLDHIIATIDSIVKNNLKYKKKESELESVTISMSFTNRGLLNKIISHYKDNPINCEVKPGLYLMG